MVCWLRVLGKNAVCGQGCGLVAQHLPGMLRTLGLVSSSTKERGGQGVCVWKTKGREGEGRKEEEEGKADLFKNFYLFFIRYLFHLHFQCYPKSPPPTPTSWPWHSPVLRHIKFARPMGLFPLMAD